MRGPLLLVLAFLVAPGCEPRQALPDSPRLVVLYATCSLNKDFLSPYDAEVAFTPAFERFGSQARVFRRHQTESGQSGTAFASLFSGSQAAVHGVFHHPARLRPELDLVTEVFAEAGYEVHTWLAHPMASAKLGYAQGVPQEGVHGGRLDGADEGLLALLDGVKHDPGARVLLVTNFTLTHGPYRGARLERLCVEHPSRCDVVGDAGFERLRSLYARHHIALSFDFEATVERLGLSESEVDRLRAVTRVLFEASVVELDEEFGELVEAIDSRGLADESVIVFTSDHGEIHFRDNADFHWTHGFQLAPEVLNVALMIRAPGLRPGSHEPVTRSVDVLPTLAGLTRLPSAGSTARGVDLSAALSGAEPAPELLAFSHTAMFPAPWWRQWGDRPVVRRLYPEWNARWMGVGLRSGDFFHELRHLRDGVWSRGVYDLAGDPGKRVNLFDPDDPRHAEMGTHLAQYKEMLTAAAAEGPRGVAPVGEERQLELLRSLGYIE
ncbi:MAG: sulfatase-like hydrolase/transferase [Myxococcota bacterium]